MKKKRTMTNIKIDPVNNQLILKSSFGKKALNVGTLENKELQKIVRLHPTYDIVVRTINQKKNKENYKGLNYEFMEYYIKTHAHAEERLPEFKEKLLLTQCHTIKYPNVKKWFLKAYPEVDDFEVRKYYEEKENNKELVA